MDYWCHAVLSVESNCGKAKRSSYDTRWYSGTTQTVNYYFNFLLFPTLVTFFVTRRDLCGATFCTQCNVCQDNERFKIWIFSTDGKIWKYILQNFLIGFIYPIGLLITPLRNHIVAKEKAEGSATQWLEYWKGQCDKASSLIHTTY